MSTSFGKVKGHLLDNMGNGLRDHIHVNRFFGGSDGPCVQLTIGSEYVQLDRKQVRKLRRKLKAASSPKPPLDRPLEGE